MSPEAWERRLEIIAERLRQLDHDDDADDEIDRRFDEIRSAAGIGPICSVSEGLEYIRSEGSAAHRLSPWG
jgi:hypothetical protein